MRALVQRAVSASVLVDGEVISSIGRGICVLIGISRGDTPKDIDYMVRKLINLRLFDDEEGKRWKKSVKDNQFEILCVSQFTLYSVMKGNKPDFHQAMAPDESRAFYHEFLQKLKHAYIPEKIKDGKFGAYMQVHCENDGPVTIILDSSSPKNEVSRETEMQSQST